MVVKVALIFNFFFTFKQNIHARLCQTSLVQIVQIVEAVLLHLQILQPETNETNESNGVTAMPDELQGNTF